MTNTDSPLDDLRPRIDRLLDFFTEPSEEDKYLKDLADDLEKLFELYCHKQVIEGRKEGYDHNLLGSWIFIGDNARLNNLDGLYWSYVQEFVAKDNPYREEPYEKMEYIKKTMPYASFSKVGIFKLLARADQNAKERIAKLRKTL